MKSNYHCTLSHSLQWLTLKVNLCLHMPILYKNHIDSNNVTNFFFFLTIIKLTDCVKRIRQEWQSNGALCTSDVQ